ncbi:MAG: methyltransferase domain-containing protein, partial [Desulfovibrionaceae bacterium]|nr:methyltransferase domain-containing protein [Desulfovibrionaceae bacterium]
MEGGSKPAHGARALIEGEKTAFDKRAKDRLAHGFVPDLRRLRRVPWFYNNVWRDPKFVDIHWMPKLRFVIDLARERGGRVLELGCGYGLLSLEMARYGLDVVGLDLSPENIAIAERFKDQNPYRESFGSLQYVCADVADIEWDRECFDSVVFFRSLHHLPDLAGVLAKARSWLKPGGYLLLSEPVRRHFTRESARMAAILRLVLPTWEKFETKLDRPWTASEWESAVDKIFRE